MTVFELRKALLQCDQTAKVWVTFAKEDERQATCITADRYGVRIIDSNEEISRSERIIYDEATPNED